MSASLVLIIDQIPFHFMALLKVKPIVKIYNVHQYFAVALISNEDSNCYAIHS